MSVWYALKGNVDEVRVAEGSDVAELRDAIREKNPSLQGIDPGRITIKTRPEGEALDPRDEVARIDGGKVSKTPLYVDFPEVPEPLGQVDKADKMLEALEQQRRLAESTRAALEQQRRLAESTRAMVDRVERLHTMLRNTLPKLIEHAFGLRPASRTSPFDPEFEQSLCAYYGMDYDTRSCMILGQLFPECLLWYGDRHAFGPEYFLPVGKHIYPKKQHWDAKHIDIDVADPDNGLLLMKSIEEHFRKGYITLIPQEADRPMEDNVDLKVHVTRSLHDQKVMWVESHPPVPLERPVLKRKGKGKGKWKPKGEGVRAAQLWDGHSKSAITFFDIHKKNIRIRPPSMRSLYMHAKMAHSQDAELPDPDCLIHRYQGRSEALQHLLETVCLQPGDAEVEEVVVHNEGAELEMVSLPSSA